MKQTIRHPYNTVILYRVFCALCATLLTVSCTNDVNVEWSKVWLFRTPHYLGVSERTCNFIEAEGGTKSIRVRSTNTPWEVTGLPTWLSVDKSNGTEDATINITCEANASMSSRAALLTIRSTAEEWDYSVSVSVTQVRATTYATPEISTVTFDGGGGNRTVAVTSNVTDWTVSVPTNGTPSWLTAEKSADGSSIVLTASPNPNSTSRRTYVTISTSNTEQQITVDQRPGSISATLERLTFSPESSSKTVTVTADAPWTAQTASSWIDVQPASAGAGTYEVTVRVLANNSDAERSGYIYFVMADDNKVELPVSQEAITFSLSETTLDFDRKGEEKTVIITTNAEWELASDLPAWLTLSATDGNGTTVLSVTAKENESTSARNVTLSFKPKAVGTSYDLLVTQSGQSMNLDITPLQFTNKGGSLPLSFEATGNWTAVGSASWISVTPSSGSGSTTCIVTAEENLGEARTGEVVVSFYDATYRIPVFQQAPFMTLSAEDVQFGSTGGTLWVDITSNTHWTTSVSEGNVWLSVSPETGEASGQIAVTAADNPSADGREGKVGVASDGLPTLLVAVAQTARYLTLNTVSVEFLASGGTSELIVVNTDGTFEITTDADWVTINTVSEKSFTLTATKNNSSDERTALVTVSLTGLVSGEVHRSITVTQSGYNGEDPVDPQFAIPLTLEADEAGAIVTFTIVNESIETVEYSTDGSTWIDYTSGTGIVLANPGDKVMFRGDNATYNVEDLTIDNASNISCSADCYIYGNIMSLVSSTEFATATELTKPYTFTFMFKDNVHLKPSPDKELVLPATTLADACYHGMFYGCSSLTTAPDLPATTLASDCYSLMFYGCSSLTAVPALPATTLASYCYAYMFYGCSSLTAVPALPATTLASYCYMDMFSGCSLLTDAPALPATTLAIFCYMDMFSGCSLLTDAPALPATTLADKCYMKMFSGCSSLTAAPALPAATLARYCYKNMFEGCSSLTAAPDLPATTLADFCYEGMFYGCSSLTTAPDLPATTLAYDCYSRMFSACSSLTAAPVLPATTLATGCYGSMFHGCTSLTSPPALPATTLANSCYAYMFGGCSSLFTAPELPAKSLVDRCYFSMFNGCKNLNQIKCLATDISANYCTSNWVDGVAESGLFIKDASINSWTRSKDGIPIGWTVQDYSEGGNHDGNGYLTFEALENTTFTFSTNDLQYSLNGGATWTTLTADTATPTVQAGDRIMWKASGLTPQTEVGIGTFSSTGKFNAEGNVMSLLYGDSFADKASLDGYDYAFASLFSGSKIVNAEKIELPATTLATDCYYYMFRDCTSLTTAPALPATTLASYCYERMFYGCSSLTAAPALPATKLTGGCYDSMFDCCTSLTAAPDLPASTLAAQCYFNMFDNCTSLTAAPSLPATTLAGECYINMFANCTSLTAAPDLPATTLASDCYLGMFYYCTSLTAAPDLPATTLADGCYSDMFQGCSSLTTAPELPAKSLVQGCYSNMFHDCKNLNYIKCLATDISATDCTTDWVDGVAESGLFIKDASMNSWTRGNHGIPVGWTVQDYPEGENHDGNGYLTFEALENTSFTFSTNDLQYSLNGGATWTTLTGGTATPTLQAGDRIMWKASGLTPRPNAGIGSFSSTGKFNTEGNVMSLLYGDSFADKESLDGYDYAFARLFEESMIVNAEKIELPATTLAEGCYAFMFNDCTSLITAPALPATAMEYLCYGAMFRGCTSLTAAPSLPATTLANRCYGSMFLGCSSLTAAPALPATTLADLCYMGMFENCTSLTTSPDLPATTLAIECYFYMFNGCKNLNQIKCLATDISANACTYNWVKGVAESGLFIKDASMNSWTRGESGIPVGWTVQDYPEGGHTVDYEEEKEINGHFYVDLALPSGLLWATRNVGANSPEGYGDYFAWGETMTKSNFSWNTYKWCNGSEFTQTKYNINSSYGTVDNKRILDLEDDAAGANWGGDGYGKWRMPSHEEWDELRDNCSWTWTTLGGHNGYKVTSNVNDKSIFLPAAGDRLDTDLNSPDKRGCYWSLSLYEAAPNMAWGVEFHANGIDSSTSQRHFGQSIRPVCHPSSSSF